MPSQRTCQSEGKTRITSQRLKGALRSWIITAFQSTVRNMQKKVGQCHSLSSQCLNKQKPWQALVAEFLVGYHSSNECGLSWAVNELLSLLSSGFEGHCQLELSFSSLCYSPAEQKSALNAILGQLYGMKHVLFSCPHSPRAPLPGRNQIRH